jgi:hypothetical protein
LKVIGGLMMARWARGDIGSRGSRVL